MRKSVLFLLLVIFMYSYQCPDDGIVSKKKRSVKYFLKPSSNMKHLLDREVLSVRGEKRKLDRIVDLIFDRSVVGFEYSGLKTFTAEETFDKRTGNCLSYTTMFIAMARYAGLIAKFQEVSDFSDWNRQGNLIVFSSHINSVVEIGARVYEVDFQYRSEKKFWNRKIIDDDRAEAHYFNNIGSEALLRGDLSSAEEYLGRSIEIDNSFSFAWTNFGVLLKNRGRVKEAVDYFSKAIILDKHNHTAKHNLAGLYESQGDLEKARKLKEQIRKVLNKNPYYHFNLGVMEYNLNNFSASITHFKRAIKKDPKKPEFYVRISAAYYKLGNLKMSRKYLEKGQKYVASDKDKERYRKKLDHIFIKLQEER